MEKDDFTFALGRGDLVVLRAGQTFREFGQFVIVRGEQSLRAVFRGIVQVLSNCPRDGETVKCRRAAADLIEQHQRARRRVVQNRGCLNHLGHKRRTTASEII